MRYEEPDIQILRVNVENVICESPWIEDGTGGTTIPGIGGGGDSGSYGE